MILKLEIFLKILKAKYYLVTHCSVYSQIIDDNLKNASTSFQRNNDDQRIHQYY